MTLDPATTVGLERRTVHCSMCGAPWEERFAEPGTPDPDRITLCPECLLATSHGEDLPDLPPGV